MQEKIKRKSEICLQHKCTRKFPLKEGIKSPTTGETTQDRPKKVIQ